MLPWCIKRIIWSKVCHMFDLQINGLCGIVTESRFLFVCHCSGALCRCGYSSPNHNSALAVPLGSNFKTVTGKKPDTLKSILITRKLCLHIEVTWDATWTLQKAQPSPKFSCREHTESKAVDSWNTQAEHPCGLYNPCPDQHSQFHISLTHKTNAKKAFIHLGPEDTWTSIKQEG